MFKTLVNAWKTKDIRSRILFTLLLIFIYRLGSFIPVPGVNTQVVQDAMSRYDLLGFLNLFSGGSLSQFTIFAMGISPYITGSIVIQLLTIAIPALERLSKEDDGREKLEQITRYTGIGLALVQSIGIALSLGQGFLYNANFWSYAVVGITCTAGTAFLVWLGERITEKGIGNGISMLIFASIVSRVPSYIIEMFENLFTTTTTHPDSLRQWWTIIVLAIVALILVVGTVIVEKAYRKVPIQYAKKVVGRKQYGGQSTHIPLKANANGVMPLIFAMTIMQFPAMIVQIVGTNTGFGQFYQNWLGQGTVVYYIVYALLIVAFAYFYTTISANPIEISKNLQQNGGFIPGIRPGKPTSDYLSRIQNRLTLFGALFLMVIAIVPTLVLSLVGQTTIFGATSLLIMVSVAIECSEQLEQLMLMRHYRSFLS